MNDLKWKKYPVLNDGFICLVDVMGDDAAIVQAARKSYNKEGAGVQETRLRLLSDHYKMDITNYDVLNPGGGGVVITVSDGTRFFYEESNKDKEFWLSVGPELDKAAKADRKTLRHMIREGHTSPFEMCEVKFLVRVPMDCWRQWIRHRTANVNEYSTRYTEAIDSQQTTLPQEWRLQATSNKQGSSGFLEAEAEMGESGLAKTLCGSQLTHEEFELLQHTKSVYNRRLKAGIAKEQARKDLPLSTYTEAYWKCDLHNIFNFLRLRMDSHAQLEIRSYANAMYEIVKQLFPVACEAFEDYVLHAKKFSRMEMELLRNMFALEEEARKYADDPRVKPDTMTDREWKEFMEKLA